MNYSTAKKFKPGTGTVPTGSIAARVPVLGTVLRLFLAIFPEENISFSYMNFDFVLLGLVSKLYFLRLFHPS
jgi:hypothetical protein